MKGYSKAIAATVTSIGAWLVSTGYVEAGQEQVLVASLLGLLNIIGVYAFANVKTDV